MRLLSQRGSTDRPGKSFVPPAIRLHNYDCLQQKFTFLTFILLDTLFHCTLVGAAIVDIAAVNKYIVM